MTRLINYFLRGLVVTAPVALTLYVCWRVFSTIDRWLGFAIPGVGFALTIGLITLIGFLASSARAKRCGRRGPRAQPPALRAALYSSRVTCSMRSWASTAASTLP